MVLPPTPSPSRGHANTDCQSVFARLEWAAPCPAGAATPTMRRTRPPHLGDLELTVLDHLWVAGPGDAKAVHRVIGRPRRITLNTIQSTLKRLHDKELLSREKVSHAYVYAPRVTREVFQRRALHDIVDLMMEGEPDAMLSAFVDLTERAGPEHLRRLEELVEERLVTRREEED